MFRHRMISSLVPRRSSVRPSDSGNETGLLSVLQTHLIKSEHHQKQVPATGQHMYNGTITTKHWVYSSHIFIVSSFTRNLATG